MKEFLQKRKDSSDPWKVHEDGTVYYPYDLSKLIFENYFDIFSHTSWGQKYELTANCTFFDSDSSQNVSLIKGTNIELHNITDYRSPKQLMIEILVYSSLKDTNPKNIYLKEI